MLPCYSVCCFKYMIIFIRAMLASAGIICCHVSVCPSATSRCSTETAKRRITQTTPYDSPGRPYSSFLLPIRSCHAHCHASFQAAATMFLPGEVTTTAWLPTCDVVSARQCSYPVSALSGVHLPGKSTVWRR